MSRAGALQLQATSIHGEGDKIALPPSVLEYLTSSGNDVVSGSPWIFRVGIRNPNYKFPASPLLLSMQAPDTDMDVSDDEEDDDDGDDAVSKILPYLDELKYQYLSYTHCTVVEFTQEEGYVGLPQPIAKVLLNSKVGTIPSKRTVDPAASSDPNDMQVGFDNNDEKTPGHLAYGAFDVPDMLIEVSMVSIPKGRACKLTPTSEAIMNGFYNLRDVKLVLEQSLMRTRATLSVGDIVHTWHRGVKFDLTVSEVTPPTHNSITCINTDIEVDFGAADESNVATNAADNNPSYSSVAVAGSAVGYTLVTATTNHTRVGSNHPIPTTSILDETPGGVASIETLRSEPPASQTDGVCTVQIRGDGGHGGRRRFDIIEATVTDLFQFATTISGVPRAMDHFQLVTRFPRRVIRLDGQAAVTLCEAGFQTGQELLLVEKLM